VAQAVGARQDPDAAAAPPRHIIDRRLDDALGGADQIRFLLAHRYGQALIPIRFDGIAENSSGIGVLREILSPHQTSAECAGNQTTDRSQKLPAPNCLQMRWCHGIFDEPAWY